MKVGQKVKIVGPGIECGIDDAVMGKVFPIDQITLDDGHNGNWFLANNLWYHESSLELVPDGFEIGDHVMLAATGVYMGVINERACGDDIYWVTSENGYNCGREKLHGRELQHCDAPKVSLTPPSPVKATRYNGGKPELSYLLDFPVAFPGLLSVGAPSVVAPPTFDFIAMMNEFYIDRDTNGLLEIIRFDLLPMLQKSITGDSRSPAMVGCMTITLDDLIAAYPDAFDDLVKVCANGTIKYDRNNWKNGFPTEVLIDCAMRHYRKYKMGVSRDVIDQHMLDRWEIDSELQAMFDNNIDVFEKRFETYHLSHVIWNLMVLVEQGVTS